MNTFIFGATSQDDHYLTELCYIKKKIATVGVSRSSGDITGDAGGYS